MTDAVTSLRLVDEAEEAEAAADDKVFARSIATPPGAPWDQARAAQLEARAGAPLPLGEVLHQLHRLDPWRPGQGARFVAFYVRASDVGARLQSRTQVDGHWMEVVFVSRAEQDRRTRRAVFALGAGALTAMILLVSAALAISARQSAETELTSLEQLAAAKSKLATDVERRHRQSLALDAAGARGRQLSAYLADLDWVAGAKAQGARIQAVHWDRSTLAIEVRGDMAPVSAAGRQVTKMDKPLRPGLWLWGVSAAPQGADTQPPAPEDDASGDQEAGAP